ncbi:ribosomal large subunit pseudouridylate synthase, putative [Plasmodium ovale]|uniref:Ribosomal large subunit pseudouridylate synthase, putative n=2 Tax=Plasmodium ovale TaxID=36330 RepID=A0A1A8VUU9_PLAOA|nr:ribosomal large subunit pseudouridylate synthase, putative [Plasmodium ovale curtisi]SCQ16451.1 ribosomal large subunit pseudouridylate synthase, putative [Plasmodium ovale]
MVFSRIVYKLSRHCKEQKFSYCMKRGEFFSGGNKFTIKKMANMKEEKPHITDVSPLYKSYKDHDLKIVYENDFFLVVSKPYDIKLERGKYDDMYPSVETLLRKKRNLDVFRICGQLDYATSGLLIIAKDKLSSNILNYNIESKNISKIYLAILYDHLPLDVLHINTPISKVKNSFKMKLCYNYNDYYDSGKYCYSLIYPYKHCYLNNERVTLCELRTITGRRHQLRLHSLCLGSGIVGDETYFEDMITNKYKISYPNLLRGKENLDMSTCAVEETTDSANASCAASVKGMNRINVERMMLHCWIMLKNDNESVKKITKSESINALENKIFNIDYIICEDELSKYVNEEQRTYEQCVLKNHDLINADFVNYSVRNIRRNIKNIDKKLKKMDYGNLLPNSFIIGNKVNEKTVCLNKYGDTNNIQKRMVYAKNGEDEALPDDTQNDNFSEKGDPTSYEKEDVNFGKIETINVEDVFINEQFINKNSIYLVKNEKYKNPDDLFDDIYDNVNKFNWG